MRDCDQEKNQSSDKRECLLAHTLPPLHAEFGGGLYAHPHHPNGAGTFLRILGHHWVRDFPNTSPSSRAVSI